MECSRAQTAEVVVENGDDGHRLGVCSVWRGGGLPGLPAAARAADLGNRSQLAYVAAMVYVALLFGFGHFYKGPAGIMDSTYSGLALGGVYLLSGRNLWASILTHGTSDTFAVLVLFMGWST